jgi:hypothetical protein
VVASAEADRSFNMRHGLSTSLPLVLLAACASSPPEATDAIPIVAANDVETIEISELDTGLVCERTAPTGSRIAEQQCYTKEEYAQWQAFRQEAAKREVDDMRDLQRNRELAAEEARRQAMQRAAGGF